MGRIKQRSGGRNSGQILNGFSVKKAERYSKLILDAFFPFLFENGSEEKC
jgi:hypothetical protein